MTLGLNCENISLQCKMEESWQMNLHNLVVQLISSMLCRNTFLLALNCLKYILLIFQKNNTLYRVACRCFI